MTQESTTSPHSAPLDEGAEAAPLLTNAERRRVLSTGRLKFHLTVLLSLGLLTVFALVFFVVEEIFAGLTPSIRADLQWKARRGALELAQTAQLGLMAGDRGLVAEAAKDYLQDPDVLQLRMTGPEGEVALAHNDQPRLRAQVLESPPGEIVDLGDSYGAWAPSMVEAAEVGRVMLLVSKERLAAGHRLRSQMLTVGGVGVGVALLLALLFVNLHIGPILRVTGAAFERLERTTEEALAAARLKSEFLANMSHEIRTPMNGIVGVIDLLERTPLSSKQRRHVQTIETSARTLLTIIDDVLDFSKLEAGKFVIRSGDFELRQLTQDVAELFAARAHGKGLELVHHVAADVPIWLCGDPDRIKQVLSNLLGNAIKFTERGHVALRVELEPNQEEGACALRFSVSDTGMGIAERDRHKLFGSFSQVDGSLTRAHGGTGLGLAICKRLVEAMGGSIGLDSVVGSGSMFWFVVPMEVADAVGVAQAPDRAANVLLVASDLQQASSVSADLASWGMRCRVMRDPAAAVALLMDAEHGQEVFDAVVVDRAVGVDEPGTELLRDACATEALPFIELLSTVDVMPVATEGAPYVALSKPYRVSELYNGLVALLDGLAYRVAGPALSLPASRASQGVPQVRGRVLVVDDNEVNRMVAVDLLSDLGYVSDVACDGQEAVHKVQSGEFDAVLMDCQMPVMDGYEATRRIRALPDGLKQTPIIAVTAHALVGDRDKALQAGMDDYTAKPVRSRALERVLARWVTGSGPRSEVPRATPDNDNSQPPAAAVDDATGDVLEEGVPRSARVMEVFLRSTPGLVREVLDACRVRDVAEVTRLSHKLKGSCLSIGAAQLANLALRIELAGRAGKLDQAAVSRVEAFHTTLEEAILAEQRPKAEANDGRR